MENVDKIAYIQQDGNHWQKRATWHAKNLMKNPLWEKGKKAPFWVLCAIEEFNRNMNFLKKRSKTK